MKVVLSRKGFDSANGGIPSAVMPNGDVVSFPIPSDDKETFGELHYGSVLYSELLRELAPGRRFGHCHLDPDIDMTHRSTLPNHWKPAFGQIGPSARYLLNTVGLAPGDMILFFGWFRFVEEDLLGHHKFATGTRDMHLVWGYLQVGEILSDPDRIAREYPWHPHADQRRFDESNVLIVPRKSLSFAKSKPGCDLLPFARHRVLTAPGQTRAYWQWNPVYAPENLLVGKGRKNASRIPGCIFYPGIWQELGLKDTPETEKWAVSMVLG